MSLTPPRKGQAMMTLPFKLSKPHLMKSRPSHCDTPGRDLLRQLIAKREQTKKEKENSLERLHNNCHNAQLEVNDFNEEDADKICEQVFNHVLNPDTSKEEKQRKGAIQKLLFEIEALKNQ